MEIKANLGKPPEIRKPPKFREPGLCCKMFKLRNLIPMRGLPLLSISFLLECLLSSLGLLALEGLGGGGLDDTHSDGLPHVTVSKPSKGRELGERFDTHWLAGGEEDDSSISRLDELRVVFCGLTSTTVNLLLDLGKLARDVCRVAIQDWTVPIGDLSRVVQDDDLSSEILHTRGWLVLRIRGNISSLDVLHRHVLDVEPNVVSGGGLGQGLVVHFDGLDLSGQHVGGESDDHTGLDDTCLHTAHWHCSNTSNFVDILEGKPERLVCGSCWWDDGVESLEESGSAGLAFLTLDVPSLVPGHVGAGLQHVVPMPSRDGNEWNSNRVVSDLLDEARDFLLDFLEPSLAVRRLSGVHLVNGHDELLDTKGVGQQGVFSGLTILGDTSLELTSTRGNDKHATISLRSSSDHVLDEIPVSRGINDGDIVLGGLELPESNIDGDSSLTLSLQFVKNPCVLEGSLSRFLRLLLELLNSSLVDTSTLVDQVTSGGGLARVDVADNDNVNVGLFLSHFRSSLRHNSLVEVNQAILSLVG